MARQHSVAKSMMGDLYFEVSFIQFYQSNILPQARMLSIPPHQPQSPLHLLQLLAPSFQPPLRSEEHAILTIHFLVALDSPVIFTDIRSAGDEDAVDGVACGWNNFRHYSRCCREHSSAFFDDGLEVGKGSCLSVADDGAFADSGVDFSLEFLVDVGIGDDEEHCGSECGSCGISSCDAVSPESIQLCYDLTDEKRTSGLCLQLLPRSVEHHDE